MSICPYCKSPNTQKLSVMHQGGISTGTVAGVGATSGGLGVGVGINKQQTELSKAAAPPPTKDFSVHCFTTGCLAIPVGLVLAMFNGWAAFYWMLGVTAIAWALPFILKDHAQESAEADAAARVEWDRSAMCLSCGKKFTL